VVNLVVVTYGLSSVNKVAVGEEESEEEKAEEGSSSFASSVLRDRFFRFLRGSSSDDESESESEESSSESELSCRLDFLCFFAFFFAAAFFFAFCFLFFFFIFSSSESVRSESEESSELSELSLESESSELSSTFFDFFPLCLCFSLCDFLFPFLDFLSLTVFEVGVGCLAVGAPAVAEASADTADGTSVAFKTSAWSGAGSLRMVSIMDAIVDGMSCNEAGFFPGVDAGVLEEGVGMDESLGVDTERFIVGVVLFALDEGILIKRLFG